MAKNTMGKYDRALKNMDEYDLRLMCTILEEYLPAKYLLNLARNILKLRIEQDTRNICMVTELLSEDVNEDSPMFGEDDFRYLLADVFGHDFRIFEYFGDAKGARMFADRLADHLEKVSANDIEESTRDKVVSRIKECCRTGDFSYFYTEDCEQ